MAPRSAKHRAAAATKPFHVVDVAPLEVDVAAGLGAVASTGGNDNVTYAALALLACAVAAAAGGGLAFSTRELW